MLEAKYQKNSKQLVDPVFSYQSTINEQQQRQQQQLLLRHGYSPEVDSACVDQLGFFFTSHVVPWTPEESEVIL